MKKIYLVALLSLFLLGCVHSGSTEQFDKYEAPQFGIFFEKPIDWVQQPDPLSVVRFTMIGKGSFAVILLPRIKAADFDSTVAEAYTVLSSNKGLFNVSRGDAIVAGFKAVKIISSQRAALSSGGVVVSNLYVVRDTVNDRILYVVFQANSGASFDSNAVEQRILSSLKLG